MLKLFIIFGILAISLAGHIYAWDHDIHWQNSARTTQITLWFSLESGLDASGFISVKLSFDFNIDLTKIYAQILSVDRKPITGLVKCTTSGTVPPATANLLYFQMNYTLSANSWYGIQISGGSGSRISHPEGVYQTIEMYTRYSEAKETYIDVNPNFGEFTFGPVPSNLGIEIGYMYSDAERKTLGNAYPINLTITPQTNISQGAKYFFQHFADGVVFKGPCISYANMTPERNISELSPSEYSCPDAGSGNNFTLELKKPIQVNVSFRIQIIVENPSYSVQSTPLYAYEFARYTDVGINGYIYEDYILSNAFEVSPGSWATFPEVYPQIKFLWGLGWKNLTSNYLCAVGLFYSNINANMKAKYPIYNSVQVSFQVAQAVIGKKLKIILTIPPLNVNNVKVPGQIMPGSVTISSTFKDYSTAEKLRANVLAIDTPTGVSTILITNVQKLEVRVLYKVEFSIMYEASLNENTGWTNAQCPFEKPFMSFNFLKLRVDDDSSVQIAEYLGDSQIKGYLSNEFTDSSWTTSNERVVSLYYQSPIDVVKNRELSVIPVNVNTLNGYTGIVRNGDTFNLLFNLVVSCQQWHDFDTSPKACQSTPTA